MQTQQELFLELLGKRGVQFVIPVFQRVYSWNTEQCGELWLDVMRSGRTKNVHFIGTLLYSKEPQRTEGIERFAIIDGQQRTTTLTLLLAAAFILGSERDERRALSASRAMRLEEALDADFTPRPARIYQLDERTSAAQALSLLRPRERAWFVLTADGTPSGLIDDRSIVRHVVEKEAPETALRELCGFRNSPAPPSGAFP